MLLLDVEHLVLLCGPEASQEFLFHDIGNLLTILFDKTFEQSLELLPCLAFRVLRVLFQHARVVFLSLGFIFRLDQIGSLKHKKMLLVAIGQNLKQELQLLLRLKDAGHVQFAQKFAFGLCEQVGVAQFFAVL